MVWQIWHEPSVNLSQHYKIGSAFFGELHRLGYRWHYCASSLSLCGTACQVPDIFCASTSTCTRNNVTINMALTFMISYVMIHLAKVNYRIVWYLVFIS